MKIVKIQGGLGNQMFGYAIALSLQHRFPETIIKIDTKSFKNYTLHNGFELLDVFDCPVFEQATGWELAALTWYFPHPTIQKILKKILPRRKTDCIERPVARLREDAFTSAKDYYYDGYWQWGGYYEDIKHVIKDSFKFKLDGVLENVHHALVEEMNKVVSVGIHVRRGDYLNEPLYKGICELNYYREAIRLMEEKTSVDKYYIFSNDIAWCKENLVQLSSKPFFFVQNSGKRSYLDMYMMTQCKNLIIANSSFSWWGAYLNIHQKNIIAPQKWVNLPIGHKMQQDNWILI